MERIHGTAPSPPTPGPDPLVPLARCPFHSPGPASATSRAPAGGPFAATSAPFVALSKFVIANDKVAEVKDAFRRRPHLVDAAPGFLRMEVFSPLDCPAEIWLVTYWTGAPHFDRWHRSHLYRESHRGIPKGLKLVPGQQEIRRFEHVAS